MVGLAAARNNEVSQVHPGLSNQICFLVIVEHRHFQFVVVRRLVDGKSEFVVPVVMLVLDDTSPNVLNVHEPSRSLSTTQISLGFLRLFPKPRSTVRVLLAHGFAIRQVLRSVDDSHQCSNWRAVNRHVRKDARGMVNFRKLRHVESVISHKFYRVR